jgi:hypothetical protein
MFPEHFLFYIPTYLLRGIRMSMNTGNSDKEIPAKKAVHTLNRLCRVDDCNGYESLKAASFEALGGPILMTMVAGSCEWFAGERKHLTQAGDVFILPSSSRIRAVNELTSPFRMIMIRFDFMDGEVGYLGDRFGRGGQAVYRILGLKAPEKVQKLIDGSGTVETVSLETLPEIAGDYIFLSTFSEKASAKSELTNNPIWKQLDAVKNNRVIELDHQKFYFSDPISIHGQLNLIVDLLNAV